LEKNKHDGGCFVMPKRGQYEDLTGKRFGNYTVLRFDKRNKSGIIYWLCQCECGTIKSVSGGGLKYGNSKSCGCLNSNQIGERSKIDLTGKRFGKLIVIKRLERKNNQTGKWLCKCDCGGTNEVRTTDLTGGNTKSCGCLTTYKHGGTGTRLFHIWDNMKRRCGAAKNSSYKDYGGRGIRVCDEWLDFAVFKEWALLHGYAENLTIDRKDNNGNYEPDNCRWATMKEQGNNQRGNINITYNGETKTLKQWSEFLGIKYITLLFRIRYGWTIEDVFNKPLQHPHKHPK
jgi:hypothetical protein